EAEELVQVVGRDRHALSHPRDAGVAGRAVERREPRALPELPAERVLAPAAADHEDPHAASVPEVAHAGEDHRGAARVGRPDDLFVTRAAARLDDGRGTRLERLLEAVG